jgi:glycine/D-amino acid oxidase-like deaminating enzyme/nitrite reductase/ring-hydroxylating ferredoxin subunit
MEDHTTTQRGLPDRSASYWREAPELPSFPQLSEDTEAEVAIVGAGITGVTTAYLLAKEGVNVVLLDAGTILNGTTGYTTAKITSQHGAIYDQLLKHLGEEHAKAYYQANQDAAGFIRTIVEEHGISCELTPDNSYVYAASDRGVKTLEKEWEAYQRLGIPGSFESELPLPLRVKAAIRMNGQAQFHPVRYLEGLVGYLIDKGAAIYEHTPIVDIDTETENRPKIITKDGKTVSARHVVVASHFPFCDKIGMYYARMHAERSYVVAIETETNYPGGMYINADEPRRSLRTAERNDQTLVLIGGESHKPGEKISTLQRYAELEAFGRSLFAIQSIPFRWSAQDLITLDRVPYVGQITGNHPNVFVATGFGKWGMTNGTAAAMLLRDLIMQRENPYKELFKPSRFHAGNDIKQFVVQNSGVAKTMVAGKLENADSSPSELKLDEGGVVEVDGKRCGAYRDKDGNYHVVDTTCTHMGCELEWNDGERSWDCPCHGSRFSAQGNVIEGPAFTPLKTMPWPDNSDGAS